MSHKVTTVWDQKMHFESMVDNQIVALDQNHLNPSPQGVSPKKLMLTALTGCTAMDVVSILERKLKVPFSHFSVSATGTLTDEHPRMYQHIYMTYSIKLEDPTHQTQVLEAVNLSLTQFCGVYAMMSKICKVEHHIEYL